MRASSLDIVCTKHPIQCDQFVVLLTFQVVAENLQTDRVKLCVLFANWWKQVDIAIQVLLLWIRRELKIRLISAQYDILSIDHAVVALYWLELVNQVEQR